MHTPLDSASGTLAKPIPSGSEEGLRDACENLDVRIRNGEAARAEEYLARQPELDAEAALDLIYAEYVARREMGEPSPREEILARFPEWRSALERQFQLEELLDEPLQASDEPASTSGSRFRIMRLLAR